MTHRLPTAYIDVPTANRAADIVIDALREAGIDPAKATKSLTANELMLSLRYGMMTRETFVHSCRNLLVLNPALAGKAREA